MKSFKNSFFYIVLFLLPKNCISRFMGRVISVRFPPRFTQMLISAFVKRYGIDAAEAEKPLPEYKSLQEFFVRKLKAYARPIAKLDDVIVSPCDGTVSERGILSDGMLVQAKGRTYHLLDLLRNEQLFRLFSNERYATIYLSPRDYHRFHAPITGIIEETIYIPGTLWPVNSWAVKNVPQLFCQNERVITIIKCPRRNLRLAHVAVGATLVGKIELEYVDLSSLNNHRGRAVTNVAHPPTAVSAGQELGKFMFGSTIILLWQSELVGSVEITPTKTVKMGEVLTNLIAN